MRLTRVFVSTASILAAAHAVPALAQGEIGQSERKEIETIVREYLVANPEVLVEAMTALQEKQATAQKDQQASVVAASRDALTTAPEGMVLGNPDGDITITEFFDYNCGYCKQALADMGSLLEADGDIRFVLKEFPILGMGSLEASRVAMAVSDLKPESYGDFHRQLLGSRGGADKASALAIAGDLGIDVQKIEAQLSASTHMQALQQTQVLASELQISGTPTYVIGDEVIQARVGLEGLKTIVAAMRECGATRCD